MFWQNPFFLDWAAQSIRRDGTIRLPFGSGRTSPIDTRDVAEVIAVGVNCLPPADAGPLVATAARVADKPVVVYPNSGEAWVCAGGWKGADWGSTGACTSTAASAAPRNANPDRNQRIRQPPLPNRTPQRRARRPCKSRAPMPGR